jgi:hypothetical protein
LPWFRVFLKLEECETSSLDDTSNKKTIGRFPSWGSNEKSLTKNVNYTNDQNNMIGTELSLHVNMFLINIDINNFKRFYK